MATILEILFVWNLIGLIVFTIVQLGIMDYLDDNYIIILNPYHIYQSFELNYFGYVFLTALFNAFCPVITIGYWSFKFIQFICTIGRK